MDTPVQRLVAYVPALSRRVPLVVIGGLTRSVWGTTRGTQDVDVLVAETDLDALDTLGEELGLLVDHQETQGLRKSGMTRFRLHDFPTGPVRMDVITADHPYYRRVIERRIDADLPGADITVPVLTAEDLVILKTLADRPRDRADVIDVLKTQGDRLDRALVERECAAIGIDPPW